MINWFNAYHNIDNLYALAGRDFLLSFFKFLLRIVWHFVLHCVMCLREQTQPGDLTLPCGDMTWCDYFSLYRVVFEGSKYVLVLGVGKREVHRIYHTNNWGVYVVYCEPESNLKLQRDTIYNVPTKATSSSLYHPGKDIKWILFCPYHGPLSTGQATERRQKCCLLSKKAFVSVPWRFCRPIVVPTSIQLFSLKDVSAAVQYVIWSPKESSWGREFEIDFREKVLRFFSLSRCE